MAESVQALSVDEVDVERVWGRLKIAQDAVLIDVRTKPEWEFVGIPDLSRAGKEPVLLEWKNYPEGTIDASFADRLTAHLNAIGATPDTDLFFICRSGARSLSAAKALAARGFRACHNVAGGFEGPTDAEGHRGTVSGWKAAGLPWRQG
jgi:rhodanese-related sulfurtransferase